MVLKKVFFNNAMYCFLSVFCIVKYQDLTRKIAEAFKNGNKTLQSWFTEHPLELFKVLEDH